MKNNKYIFINFSISNNLLHLGINISLLKMDDQFIQFYLFKTIR